MGPQVKERKKREAVVLPWKATQADMGTFVREWKKAESGRDFQDKFELSKPQWLKCVELANRLRKKGVPMKILKVNSNFIDGLDLKLLKQIAESA